MAGSSLLRRLISSSSLLPRWKVISSSSPDYSSCCARTMSTMSVESRLTLPSSPWLMLPPAFEGGDMIYNFYSLAKKEVVSYNKRGRGRGGGKEAEELPDDEAEIVGSSHGWLALFNQRNCDLFLSNPLTRSHIKLPPIHTLPIPEEYLRDGCCGCVSKVIISSSPDDGNEECRAMMICSPGGRLAFCCPGRSTEWSWTPIGGLQNHRFNYNCPRCYEEFVYSSRQGHFFCLTEMDSDDLEGWDLKDPVSPRMDWLDQDLLRENYYPWLDQKKKLSELKQYRYPCRPLRYLVFAEHSNQLFLVTRHLKEAHEDDDGSTYPYKTIGFDVHEIDPDGRKLNYMEGGSLHGLAMFVGLNHSFAILASEFPELKPNSIYYTDGKEVTPPKWVDKIYGGHDVGIFDYKNRTISPCYYPCDVQSIKRIMPAPLWFTPSPH